jgi:chromosome segregation ATPase
MKASAAATAVAGIGDEDRQGSSKRTFSASMNLKTLRKKIQKLETRLQDGPAKLARWKSKLAKLEKAKAQKAKRKAAAPAAQRLKPGPKSAQREKKPSAKSPPATAADTQGNKPAAKVKRKLNLSPERRAQLSAAMKGRWAAKRAGAETSPQNGSSEQALPAS